LCGPAAFAATFAPETRNIITPGHLDDLLQVDALGFECVAEEDIDRAFHATGKGLRLPRTCLPEPCSEALAREELAALIGRPPTQSEWDDYYTRYADTCRRETIDFGKGPKYARGGWSTDPRKFWGPLAGRAMPDSPIRRAINPPRSLGRTAISGLSIPLFGGGVTISTPTTALIPSGGDGGGGGGGGSSEVIVVNNPGSGTGTGSGGSGSGGGGKEGDLSPVLLSNSGMEENISAGGKIIPTPLPGAAFLLVTALAAVPILRRRRLARAAQTALGNPSPAK
jgi:hypothetical protein